MNGKSPFVGLSSMTKADFEALGFRGGLEIHQQLLTSRKLFCRCPAGVYTDKTDAAILRHMRPTLSEMGEYDPTALMEFKTRKEIVYLLNRDTVCTYEMDDAPPFEMDPEALEIAMEIALMLNLNIVDELHIARKQYLDGSIPTGFQRTTILGIDGFIHVDGKRVGITQLGLEEDSCRIVSDIGHTVTFRTDRLGMPLIETVTEPVLYHPYEFAATAETLRQLVRSTGRVRTGHGAARQDVNVSITGGTRIEIKGVASIRAIPMLTYLEAERQWNLIRIAKLLAERGLDAESFQYSWQDVTQIVSKAHYGPVKDAVDRGFTVGAVRLPMFAGILGQRIGPGLNFARELSERIRVIACLMDIPNMVHSDSMEQELTNRMWEKIRHALRARREDAVVVVWGNAADVRTAVEEIGIRAREAFFGVPSETRQARSDGTTGFERLLPGPQRMYPDTDLPPVVIDPTFVDTIRSRLPEPPWERRKRYEQAGLPQDSINTLMRHPEFASLFEQVASNLPIEAHRMAAVAITQRIRSMLRRGIELSDFLPNMLSALFEAVSSGRIRSSSLFYVLWDMALHRVSDMDELMERYAALEADSAEVLRVVEELVASPPHFLSSNPESRRRMLLGELMRRLRGRLAITDAEAIVSSRLMEVADERN